MSSDVAELERGVDGVPDGWQEVRLGDVSRSFAGGTPSRSNPAYYGPGIPWLKSGEVRAGRISVIEEQITEIGLRESSARIAKAGSPVIAMYGATAGVAGILEIDAALNQAVLAIEPVSAKLDGEYCFQMLSAEAPRLLTMTQGSGQPNLSKGLIDGLLVALPPLDEQQRIAEVLRSVDEAIAANQSALEQSEAALSALSDELFAASLSDEDSVWPQHPLEDMLENIIDYRGVPPPKADSGIPLLTAKNVRFGYLDFEPREFIAAKDYDSWMRRGFPSAGDIMFTTEAPLGNVAEFPDIKAALGQRTLTLVPKARVLNAKFLKWLLLSKPAQNLIWSHATGSTAKGIKQRTFRKLKFGFPALDEQVRIAQLLEDIGGARDAAKRTGEAYATMKAHLMSDLLSGRVRVPV
jgi:type I restriction enzyme S subunit